MQSVTRELFANNGHYRKTSVIREFSNNGCSRITDFYWTKLDPLFANFTVSRDDINAFEKEEDAVTKSSGIATLP